MRIERFLAESPLFSLHALYLRLLADFERQLATEGVRFTQALILTSLFFETSPVQPGHLVRVLACSKSNISHALRDLERRKWLERSIGANDARTYHFQLTRSGRRKAQNLIRIFDSAQSEIEAAGGSDLVRAIRTYSRQRPSSHTTAAL